MWTLQKIFYSGDIGISALSRQNTPMILDKITNGIVYEPLARSDDYLN